ncbi:sigma-54-dependent Fis family transcriptional regulator [Photobacterium gaetbulicola]|uniref:Putative sigma-54 dependent DNA-binding response regulator n=1 Tax=Photobacterium gaetbulicola Gung47 TaxID=658445 RepID=A0A0C5X138_9GAMM|nr:sigma-54-dependent Fis family transcriptional regulator [Photobacterium gaetbulicola]AJR09040.1 putative sigma-54 dependent DNA-binding response regulator [Photobacterium gaetbulicola Gung47]PSU04840.1 sigma-54-dependent Fis family transcriptional regulator [Photobacterium gaetbulicola]
MDTLLVIEDDIGIQKQLKWHLTDYNLVFAANRQEAITALRRFEPNVVTLDLGLPPDQTNASEGLKTLKEILTLNPNTKVIVITGNDDKEHALKAIEDGAHDYYLKPIDSNILTVIIDRAFNLAKLELENIKQQENNYNSNGFIGCSAQMQYINQAIKQTALADIPALIIGECGTGKKTVARTIHQQSVRHDKPIHEFHCPSLEQETIEQTLFGTGSDASHQGILEESDGGTLIIDEISLLPLSVQKRLLQFLRTKKITYSSSDTELKLNVNVIGISRYPLEDSVNDNRFLSELYVRLSSNRINLPALREHSEDILLYAQTLLHKARTNNQSKASGFTNDALQSMLNYHWPGNLSELTAAIQSAIVNCHGKLITRQDLPFTSDEHLDRPLQTLSLRSAREQVEKKAILQAVAISNGNISKAAGLLGITRPTLYTLIEKHGIPVANK